MVKYGFVCAIKEESDLTDQKIKFPTSLCTPPNYEPASRQYIVYTTEIYALG